ncbi:MAG: XRE family transcriptional regulator [Geminicoccaceae bacterium]
MSSPIADRLRRLRRERELTIDALASRAGVSRSMISLIERGESSPTANILDKLAAALGVTLASLFAGAAPVSPLSRRAAQPEWTDPETGYRRRNLSPPGFPSRLELVEVVLQPGMRVTYDTATREPAFDQQVWLIEGQLLLTVGTDRHELAEGDCLAMRLDRPTTFHNPGQRPSRHLVALCPAAP